MARAWVPALLLIIAALACDGADTATRSAGDAAPDRPDAVSLLPPCGDAGPAVVVDVDETLTTADEEFVMQLGDGTYEPLARAGGAALVTDYATRGYFVLYLTARSEEMVLNTGETAHDATLRWLSEHEFPTARSRLVLAPTNAMVAGEPAAAYKTTTMTEMQAEGFSFDYAYGNADSDIAAYAAVGIDKAATFIIGELAGVDGTVAVTGDDWTAHRAEHLPSVGAVCRP